MKTSIIIPLILAGVHAAAQTICSLDATHVDTTVRSGYFRMGHAGPPSRELLVNSRYLTIGGVPRIPVMGELQYSRMPRERWEDEILKMKAAGVNVIATYSFWNHHEEVEGSYDWSGNKDLRRFVKLCGRLGVLVYPRIGPWSHGEARNGGTPDWILRKRFIADRSMDPVYQTYVDRYFRQLGLQLKGLMYKDGGPVAWIQLENEYWKGPAGEPYIRWLKQTALKYGMDVPLYTVTGWGNGSLPEREVIPLWGGYPDESWTPNIEKITGCDNYSFQPFRDDSTIGNVQVKKKEGYDYSSDPYFTCEMGVGIFSSIHRRPIVQKGDNVILMDFPYTTGDKAFAARVLVEYFNSDRLDFSTDSSWLSSDLYYFPPVYGSKDVYPIVWSKPSVASDNASRTALAGASLPGFRSWTLTIPCDYRDGLNNVYLAVKYQGDRISVRWNNKLIADDLNNNTDWLMDLRRGDDQLQCQDLELEIRPWTGTSKMYFDKAPSPADDGKAYFESIRLVPEYQAAMPIPE